MYRSLRSICGVWIALLSLTQFAKAQMPTLKVVGDDQGKVYLQKLDIDVRITGSIAITTWQMTFKNTTNRVLEGELNFPLPDGLDVSRYAIDINGKMREAVPVEKTKATRTFEAVEHRRVDPGLLEKTAGNSFRTRIYPINPGSTRTVLIGYEEELPLNGASNVEYRLPLAFKQRLESFSVKINVLNSTLKPELLARSDRDLVFGEWENNYTAAKQYTNFMADQDLFVRIPKAQNKEEVLMQRSGNRYVYLINSFVNTQNRTSATAKVLPKSLTIVWDASLSGLQRNHEKELALLDGYLKELKNAEISLVTFDNTVAPVKRFSLRNGDWAALKSNLKSMVYDGATQLGNLDMQRMGGDAVLLFSDGHNTFGFGKMKLPNVPVHCINTAAATNYAYLKYITQSTGGNLIDLTKISTTKATEELLGERFQFIGIKNSNALEEHYPSMPTTTVNGLSVAGFSYEPKQEVVLQFGYGNRVTMEKKVQLDFNNQATDKIDLMHIWAKKKIAELDILYDDNQEAIGYLARKYGIVTRNTSLLVLEDVRDYVRYKIDPPAELREEYDRIIKEEGRASEAQKNTLMANATSFFNELLEWWNKKFDPDAIKPIKKIRPVPSPDRARGDMLDEAVLVRGVTANSQVNRRTAAAETMAVSSDSKALNEVVTVGYSRTNSSQNVSGQLEGRVAGVAINGNQHAKDNGGSFTVNMGKRGEGFADKIKGVPVAQQYDQYLKLRADNLSDPIFYFEIGSYFMETGRKELGLKVLSNMAELSFEDYELFKMLGYKLREIGEVKPALYVFKKVLEWRPMEPQSYRDYALTLQDDGCYQQALDSLYEAINHNYDSDIASKYNGIEETIVTEINQLVSLHRGELNISKIPRTLLKDMPVDTRVVINWNMDDTDIDLWVTDPNGEKCYYSHSLTGLGGRISRDFTRGFGPEQFMLKTAKKGKYKVEIDYYGNRQVRLAGATTILAEIYTHYGTAKQTRKLITLQMKKKDKGGVYIGEFSF